ncbi:MAG: response regulator, partial [Nocardioidaceae bacterium]
ASAPRVLVVDDTPSIRLLIRTNLELDGWDVVESVDGKDCLDRVAELRPDIITIDAVMPNLDGFATVAALRARSDTATVPIVMVTTQAQAADVKRGADVGSDAYLTKPFDPDELVATLRRVLSERGA